MIIFAVLKNKSSFSKSRLTSRHLGLIFVVGFKVSDIFLWLLSLIVDQRLFLYILLRSRECISTRENIDILSIYLWTPI